MTSPNDEFRFFGVAIGIIISCAGTIGNLLAITAYCSNKRIRTTFNLLVVNLAIVDFIISTIVLPIIIYGYRTMSPPFSAMTCSLFGYFYYASHYTSAVFLVVISFNRFLHVSKPNTTYWIVFSKKGRRIVIAFAWLLSLLCLFPLIFTSGFGWNEDELECAFTRNNLFAIIYSKAMRVLFQFLPLMTMMAMYGLIFYTVKKSHASVDNPKISTISYDSSAFTTVKTSAISPASIDVKRPSFKHQLSCEVTTPSTKTTIVKTPDLDIFANRKLTFPTSGRLDLPTKLKHKSITLPRAISDDSSEYVLAVLRRNTIQSRHAEICRTNTIEDMSNLSGTFQSHFLAGKLNGLKTRSATIPNVSNLAKEIEDDQSHNSIKLLETIEGKEAKPIGKSKPSLKLYIPQRPRYLSVTPERQISFVPMRNLKRSHTACSPGLKSPYRRRGSISESFNNMMDFLKKEKVKQRRSVLHAKAQRRLLYMSIVICFAYAICSLPSFFVNITSEHHSLQPQFYMGITNLTWLTSMINPIVYAAMNVQFRREYSRLVQKVVNFLLGRSKNKSLPTPIAAKPKNLNHSGFVSVMKPTIKASESSISN